MARIRQEPPGGWIPTPLGKDLIVPGHGHDLTGRPPGTGRGRRPTVSGVSRSGAAQVALETPQVVGRDASSLKVSTCPW